MGTSENLAAALAGGHNRFLRSVPPVVSLDAEILRRNCLVRMCGPSTEPAKA